LEGFWKPLGLHTELMAPGQPSSRSAAAEAVFQQPVWGRLFCLKNKVDIFCQSVKKMNLVHRMRARANPGVG
jgi:hypothetical protein